MDDEIFFGKAGIVAGSKFKITLSGKDFSYSDDKEQGYFFEEIVWNALKKAEIYSHKLYEVVVTTDSHKLYVSFGDQSSMGDGENTLSFSLDEITEEQIVELLSDQIQSPEDVIFMEWTNGEITVFDPEEEKSSTFTISELNPVLQVTGLLRVKLWANRHKWNIIGISLLILIPATSIMPIYNYLISTQEKKILELQKEKKDLKANKNKSTMILEQTKRSYMEMQNVKDIFDTPLGEKKIDIIFNYGK